MRKSLAVVKHSPQPGQKRAAVTPAAELALKAHVLISTPEILAELTDADTRIREMGDMIDLTEAPEDAVCSLVADLLRYCERENIDWTEDVMLRAWQRFRRERAPK